MPLLAPRQALRAPTATLLFGLALLGFAPAALAQATQAINVSRLVIGSQQSAPAETLPTTPCQTCSYATTQVGGATDGYTSDPGPYLASAWPPSYGATLSAIAVTDELDLGLQPPTALPDGGVQGAHRRARARFDATPLGNPVREVTAQTWSNGSSRSLVGHAIRILPAGSQALATYVEFKMPRELRAVNLAYDVQADGNYDYKRPKHFQARSTVDVIVDGLPVWSSSSMALQPQRIVGAMPNDRLQLYFDNRLSAITEDTVTLFLGYLTPGQVRQVNLLLRSEVRHEARFGGSGCVTDTDSVGQKHWRCHSQLEGLSQPAFPMTAFTLIRRAVRVFTR